MTVTLLTHLCHHPPLSIHCAHRTLDSPPTLLSPITNPPFAVQSVPLDLADILATPSEDTAVLNKRNKRMTDARGLMSNKCVQWLKEEEEKRGTKCKKEEALKLA